MAPEPQCSGDSRIGRERESSLLCPTGANFRPEAPPLHEAGASVQGVRRGREERKGGRKEAQQIRG